MLAEQIAKSMAEVGPEETLSIMCRALTYVASTTDRTLEFTCDLGQVTIEPRQPITND